MVALVTITSITAVVAAILYIVANVQSSNYNVFDGGADPSVGTLLAAANWSEYAGVALLATLIVGGITWKRNG